MIRAIMWLEEVYSAVEFGHTEEALDRLANGLLDPQQAGDFATVDAILAEIEVEHLGENELVAILSLTNYAKDKFTQRVGFIARAEARLRELSRESIEALIGGLR